MAYLLKQHRPQFYDRASSPDSDWLSVPPPLGDALFFHFAVASVGPNIVFGQSCRQRLDVSSAQFNCFPLVGEVSCSQAASVNGREEHVALAGFARLAVNF